MSTCTLIFEGCSVAGMSVQKVDATSESHVLGWSRACEATAALLEQETCCRGCG